VDALASRGDEGRGTLRKAAVRREQPLPAAGIRMGKPTYRRPFSPIPFGGGAVRKPDARYRRSEHIGLPGRTRGTETSKYPEERKSTETPLVVASERGPDRALT